MDAAYRAARARYFGDPFNCLRSGLIAMVLDGGGPLSEDEIKSWQQRQVSGLTLIDETAMPITRRPARPCSGPRSKVWARTSP